MVEIAAPARSPRAERTRSALLDAGFELMVERPIDGIPIDELVAKAGVAKGSFFNHFNDKYEFAAAVANEVRCEVEDLVTQSNAGISNPLARLVGGMQVAARFALEHPRRSAILLRNTTRSTASDHPLNKGLHADIMAAYDQGLIRPEARQSGVLYWLGLCQILMANLIEAEDQGSRSASLIRNMLVLGLAGLGVPPDQIGQLVDIEAT